MARQGKLAIACCDQPKNQRAWRTASGPGVYCKKCGRTWRGVPAETDAPAKVKGD